MCLITMPSRLVAEIIRKTKKKKPKYIFIGNRYCTIKASEKKEEADWFIEDITMEYYQTKMRICSSITVELFYVLFHNRDPCKHAKTTTRLHFLHAIPLNSFFEELKQNEILLD